MTKNRLEAFSDGVIAVIVTIMVLELTPPCGTAFGDMLAVVPGWLRYALSFVYVGIYWVNHHALFERVERVDWATLWANLHLLFWMSLIPFVTAWAAEHPMAPAPVALYGVVLFLCARCPSCCCRGAWARLPAWITPTHGRTPRTGCRWPSTHWRWGCRCGNR